jgi:hypothetical protein
MSELRNARIEQAIRQFPDASATRIAGMAECSSDMVLEWRRAQRRWPGPRLLTELLTEGVSVRSSRRSILAIRRSMLSKRCIALA